MQLKNRAGYQVPEAGSLDLSDHVEVGEFVLWNYLHAERTAPMAYMVLSSTLVEIVDIDDVPFDELRLALADIMFSQGVSAFDVTFAAVNLPEFPMVVWEPHDDRLITKWER